MEYEVRNVGKQRCWWCSAIPSALISRGRYRASQNIRRPIPLKALKNAWLPTPDSQYTTIPGKCLKPFRTKDRGHHAGKNGFLYPAGGNGKTIPSQAGGNPRVLRRCLRPGPVLCGGVPSYDGGRSGENPHFPGVSGVHAGLLPGISLYGRHGQRIATPRRASPRLAIPAGSIGIAGEQTGGYPLSTPGGWQLIGRTPVDMFRPHNQEEPTLLKAGDHVHFRAVTEEEYKKIRGEKS